MNPTRIRTLARRGVGVCITQLVSPLFWQTTVTLPMSASRCHSRGPLL